MRLNNLRQNINNLLENNSYLVSETKKEKNKDIDLSQKDLYVKSYSPVNKKINITNKSYIELEDLAFTESLAYDRIYEYCDRCGKYIKFLESGSKGLCHSCEKEISDVSTSYMTKIHYFAKPTTKSFAIKNFSTENHFTSLQAYMNKKHKEAVDKLPFHLRSEITTLSTEEYKKAVSEEAKNNDSIVNRLQALANEITENLIE